MTSLPVKDLGAIANHFTSAAKASEPDLGGSFNFQAVWNRQTAGIKTEEVHQKENANNTSVQNAKDSLASKGVVKESESTEIKSDSAEKPLSDEELEAAMEMLNTAAVNIVQQIAEELQITEEELNSIMDDLGMEQLSLLQPENVTQLVLAAKGFDDTLSLLTDEDLYQTLQSLHENLTECIHASSQEAGIMPEQLSEIAEKMMLENQIVPKPLSEEEPLIAVEVVTTQEDTGTDAEEVSNDSHKSNGIDTGENVTQSEKIKTEASSGSTKEHKETTSDKENRNNMFVQNLADNLLKANVNSIDNVAFSEVDTENIMKQIMDYMKVQVKPDMSNLEMQLHPESLGTLRIQLSAKEGLVTAQFITQNEGIKAALESQMVQLKEQFDEQGVKVESIEVTVQSHELDSNQNQGSHGHGEETPEKKVRMKRLNLNLPIDLEEITQEEKIAMEMMEVNGNTVDYTA